MSDTQTIQEPTLEQFEAELNAQIEAGGAVTETPEVQPDAQADETATQDAESGESQSPDESEPVEDGTEPEKAEEQKKPETTEKKPLTKEEKEKVRQENSWKKIQEEKDALRREKEAIEAQKAEIALKTAKKPEPLKDEKGFSAEDYDSFAEQAEAENRKLLASGEDLKYQPSQIELAKLKARTLRDKESIQQAEAHRVAAEEVVKQTVAKYPDLQKPETPLAKEMQKLWQSEQKERFYLNQPDGFARMAELAVARTEAGSVPSLKTKITELTKEVARLTKLSSPSRGSAGSLSKPDGELTEEDVLQHMVRIDANGGFRI